jgi:hypothetical protein
MTLPLEPRLSIGVQTIHRRTEPAEGPWLPTIAEMEALGSKPNQSIDAGKVA